MLLYMHCEYILCCLLPGDTFVDNNIQVMQTNKKNLNG